MDTKQITPVSIQHVTSYLINLINNNNYYSKTINLYSYKAISYKEMIVETARVLNKRPIIFNIPIFSPKLSKLWVTLFGSSKFSLVSPLVDSLKHDLIISNETRNKAECEKRHYFEMALLAQNKKIPLTPKSTQSKTQKDKNVRSIQRIPYSENYSCNWVAKRFALWLQKYLKYLLKVKYIENKIIFYLLLIKKPLLVLKYAEDKVLI